MTRARIQARVLRFETGNLGDAKQLGDGIWEAWLDFDPGYRIYFGREGRAVILLVLGGSKSSQTKDIAQAKKYWAAYRRSRRVAKRSKDWNEGLAEDLRDPRFAREFLTAAVAEGCR